MRDRLLRWTLAAVAVVVTLVAGARCMPRASADPFPMAPQKVGGVGPDGNTHALATDNSGTLTVIPSTGSVANFFNGGVASFGVLPDAGTVSGTCYGSATPTGGRIYLDVTNSVANSGSPVLTVTWSGPSGSGTHSLAVGGDFLVPLGVTTTVTCSSTSSYPVLEEYVERG